MNQKYQTFMTKFIYLGVFFLRTTVLFLYFSQTAVDEKLKKSFEF